jgi:hypothetical protein
MAKELEFQSRLEQDFSLLHVIHTNFGTHPAFYQWVLKALSLVVKRRGHEADH